MSDIWVGRFNRWMEKLLNAKGGPVLVDLSPSIQAAAEIYHGPEEAYLQGWYSYFGSVSVTAVAAQFSRVLLRNPQASGVILVVEMLQSSAVFDFAIVNHQPDLASIQAAQLRRIDGRSGFGGPTGIISSDTSATQTPGAATTLLRWVANQPVITYERQEIMLLPDDGLWMVSDAVNLPLAMNFRWRERSLETSELT